jgi:PKD repeat protein
VNAAVTVPVAGFTTDVSSGSAPLIVQFTDTTTNTPTSWSWDFGDGGTSSEQNPSYTYTTAGTYTTSLTATNAAGSSTSTQTTTITVTSDVPVASFINDISSGSAPLTVQFTDTSTNSPTSWDWDFGDGNSNTTESPSYIYTTAGTYTVTLTAINAGGSNTSTQTTTITVTSGGPTVAFTSDMTSGTAPLTVQFTDTSTGSPTSWSWDFGDGQSSSIQNPRHTYMTAGTYTVTLTAINADGSNVATKTNFISVNAAQTVTPLVPTYAITVARTATGSSVDTWLAQQNAEVATVSPTTKSPGYDILSALIGCGVIAGITLCGRS